MIVYAALASLLLAAAVCFAVGRVAPARQIGLGAAALALIAAAMVALAPAAEAEAPPVTVLALSGATFTLSPSLGAGERAIAVALLGGGSAALLALAGAIARGVRGFGALFAWALVTLAAALLSLMAPPLSLAQPLAWSGLTIAGYASLRASGAVAAETPPLGPTFGLLASALLAGGLVAAGEQIDAGALPAWPAALCGLVAALGIAGSPPLAGARNDATAAPAPLGGLIYGLAAPAAGLGWLLRGVAALPDLPAGWSVALGLIGALGALACAAGALGVRGLRALLAWVTAGMSSAVVAAAGLEGPLAAIAGPGLLVATMLAATLGAAGAASLARTTGSDDYTDGGAAAPRAAGALWALAAAAALGLPPLWGFWPRLWLLQAAQEQQPWLLAPLLAAGALTALALLAPLARLWGEQGAARALGAAWADLGPATLAGLPLLALGLAPGLAWAGWLAGVPGAPAEPPFTLTAQVAAAAAGLALVALAAGVALARPDRTLPRDPDEEPVRLAPDALGAALRPLAWLASPEPLLRRIWRVLQRASEGLHFVMGLFEQRYYLLGVLAALLTIMLLMAQ